MKNSSNNDEMTDVIEITAGRYSALVITKDGKVYGCGYNGHGNLGNNKAETKRNTLVEATDYQNATTISATRYNTVSSDINGEVYTWGYNGYGQLGNGTYDAIYKPTSINKEVMNVEPHSATISVDEDVELFGSLNNSFNLIEDVIDSENITYESVNTEIATVSEKGIVTGKKLGRTQIKVIHTISGDATSAFINVTETGSIAVPKVEIGNEFMVSLKSNGEVWAWGYNGYGQLGIGNKESKSAPTRVGNMSNIVDIATGDNHTLFVNVNGNVLATGLNSNGQLGDMTAELRMAPVYVVDIYGDKIENIVKVAARGNKSVALDSEGNVWAWGNGYSRYATKVANIKNAVDISAEYVVKANGKVAKISNGQELQNVTNAIEVSTGSDHTLIRTQDGLGFGIGNNTYGQLGNGNKTNATVPVIVKDSTGRQVLSGIKQLKAGNGFSMAVLENGDVYVWGSNNSYKLATDQSVVQVLPAKNDKFENVLYLSVGYNNGAIINNEGYVYSWGSGKYGNLGNKLYENSYNLNIVGLEELGLNINKVTVRKGEEYNLESYNKTFNVFKDWTESKDVTYESGDESIATVSEDGKVTGIKEGYTSITVRKNNTEYVNIAQITVLPEGIEIEPMAVTNGSHTILLKSDGTVWAYGNNTYGQLGDGTNKDKDTPVQVLLPNGVKAKQIAVGEEHTLVLSTSGEVYVFGRNYNYALGIGTSTNTPTKLGLKNIDKITAGNYQSIAITTDGYVYVWGQNSNGELGTGTYNNVEYPTRVNNVTDIIDASIGKNHTLLLNKYGKVLSSGLNVFGQTGSKEFKTDSFAELDINEPVGYISAGDNHSIALTAYGEIYTFGYNNNGQLANGTTETVKEPTKVNGMNNIMKVSAGYGYTMLLNNNREILNVGSNNFGQLGNGTTIDSTTVSKLESLDDVMNISAGNTYSVISKYDGRVWAYGDYYHGTSKVATRTNSRIPVKIGNDESYVKESEINVGINETVNAGVIASFEFNILYSENKSESEFAYETLNPEIATVDKNGNITGHKVGTTWVKVTEKGTNKELVVIVKVIKADNNNVPKVQGGKEFTVALKADGSIWTFGNNSEGQLGNELAKSSNIPNNINILSTYKDISVGNKFAMALRNDGTVWSWGDNTYGQLGQGNKLNVKKPSQIERLENIIQIATGDNHVVALDSYGNVYTWGLNENGQLGTEGKENSLRPTKLNQIAEHIVSIVAGPKYTIAIDSTGKVYTFGDIAMPEIATAVKAQGMNESIIILKADGNIVKVTNGEATDLYTNGDIVDISAKGNNALALDKDGNVYAWGENANGELGLGTTENVEIPTKLESINNVFTLGNGYNTNYLITKDGFAYATGNNTYGQLGNETYEDSKEFTYVGKKTLSITPNNYVLDINAEETLKLNYDVFNVLNNNTRELTDFTYTSSDESVATVEDGIVSTKGYGMTTITATDKATKAQSEAIRVVMPSEKQRIENITVNSEEAVITNVSEYTVTIATTENTAKLFIKSIYDTDRISIDGGTTWEYGSIEKEININDDTQTIEFLVKAIDGVVYRYNLIVNKLSNNTDLEDIVVNEEKAVKVSDTEYAMVVSEEIDLAEVVATAKDKKSKVAIDGQEPETATSTRNVETKDIDSKEVEIVVTSESEDSKVYTLTIYKADKVLDLEDLSINNEEALRVSDTEYAIVVPTDTDIANITATSVYKLANVKIDNSEAKINVSSKKVDIKDKETATVQITVTAMEMSKTYTLTIEKEKESLGLAYITVEGQKAEKNGDIYEVYLSKKQTTANVTAMASILSEYVNINDMGAQEGTSTRKVSTKEEANTHIVTVTDPEDSTKRANYTLIIYQPSKDTSIDSITIGNDKFTVTAEREEGTNNFIAKVGRIFEELDVSAVSGFKLAKVSINGGTYEVQTNTATVDMSKDPTIVPIIIKAQDGITTEEYTLTVEKLNSNVGLKSVTIDGVKPIASTTEDNAYDIKLDYITKGIEVIAISEDEFAEVKINDFIFEESVSTQNINVTRSEMTVLITVKAQDGVTEEQYKVYVHGIPDVADIKQIVVNGEEASFNEETNTFVAKVNKSITDINMSIVPEDLKAKVAYENEDAVTGTLTKSVIKSEEEMIVNLTVTAQDQMTINTYKLIIKNKSSNTNLNIVQVDGNNVVKDNKGTYIATIGYNTQSIDVYAEAADENAKVSINGSEYVLKGNTVTVPTRVTETPVKITVMAEDGTLDEYELTIRKMSNNTNLSELYVDDELIEKDSDGKYVVKIGNKEQVTIKAVAENENTLVTIDGLEEAVQTTTSLVEIAEEEKIVKVKVVAEDGSSEEHEVVLKQFSSDNTVLSVEAEGIEDEFVERTSDLVYTIEVPNTMTDVNLTVTANNEFAKVKIQNSDYTDVKATKNITITEKETEVPFTIKAENGLEQVYTVIIKLENDIRLNSIIVEEKEAVLEEDGKYHVGVNNELTKAILAVDAKNNDAIVSVDGIGEQSGSSSFEIPMDESEVEVIVTVRDPEKSERYKEYVVVITKLDSDTTLESLRVDNNDAILQENGYIAEVLIKDESYTIVARSNSNNAWIQIEDSEFKLKENSYTIDLTGVKTKDITVKVRSESGNIENYTLTIKKVSNNTELDYITVNGIETKANGKDDYTMFVDTTVNSVTIEAVTKDENAKIKADSTDEQLHSTSITLNLESGMSSTELLVTAENGDTKTYTVNVLKKSTDTSLETIKVDGTLAKVMDDNYIVKTKEELSSIVVKASSEYAKLTIEDIAYETAEATHEKELTTRTTEIKIKVTAQAGNEQIHTLVITKISTNTNITSLKLGGKLLSYNATQKSYMTIVTNPLDTENLEIVAEDEYTSINANNEVIGIGSASGDAYLPNEVTEISIKATAESGEQETRTLYVVKETSVTDLEKVTVDNVEATLGEDGNYYASIRETLDKTTIYAKTAKEYAQIDINNSGELETVEKQIQITNLSGRTVEVPIKVVATDGTVGVHTLYITRISVNANLENILVDENAIDFYDAETDSYTKFIAKDASVATIKVTSENEYATITSGENTGIKELTFATIVNSNETIVPVTITAEDGTEKEYNVRLLRISEDSSIKSVKVNGRTITEQDGKYYINVLDTNDSATVEVTSNNKFATVQIESGAICENVSTEEIIFNDKKIVTLNIVVTAQDGENVTTKQLEINRVSNDNQIEYILSGDELVTEYDARTKTYTAYVLRTKESETFTIKAKNDYAVVTSGDVSNLGNITREIGTAGEDKEIQIDVTSETGLLTTYTLRILKKSDNANVKEIDIGGELTEPDDTGLIYRKNITALQDAVRIKIIPENEKASIKIGDETAKIGTTEIMLPISTDEEVITIPVVITAQDGIVVKTYNIILTRLSNNTTIEKLTLNDEEIILSPNDVYETIIKVGIDTTNLAIKLADSNAYVRIDENAEYTQSEYTEELNTEGSKDVRKTIQVVAEDGTLKEYKLIINRKQDDLRLNSIYVDGRLVNKVDDTTYKIDVLQDKESININATSVAEDEYVQISDMEASLADATFKNYTLDEDETIIPVTVLADDKLASKEYSLIINRVSSVDELSDLGLTITVDGNEIIQDSTGNYVVEVDNSVTTANVEVIATSKTTKIQIIDGDFTLRKTSKEVTLEELNTQVPITLESADGTRRIVTLNITKTSDDNSLKEIKANSEVIQANEDGTYTVYVDQNSSSVELQATSNMELAKISINENAETRATNTETIDLADVDTKVIKVKVTALNNDVKEYTVNVIKRAKVTGKVITQTASGNEHISIITVYKTSDQRTENDEIDPREVVAQVTTSGEGTYELQLIEGEYDFVVTKQSYLEYRLTNITVYTNEEVPMDDIQIYAGDVNSDGQIELSDLTALTYNYGEVTDNNGLKVYDLNEDGKVDKLDRTLLRGNYNKYIEEQVWTIPEEVSRRRMRRKEEDNEEGSEGVGDETSLYIRQNNVFALPLALSQDESYTITSKYGMRIHPTTGVESKHTGIDIRASWHTDILAVADGEIVFAGNNGAFGNSVEIKHIVNGVEIYTFYAHLSRIDVAVGDKVTKGQTIGLEGGDASDSNPGNSTGHHLHFEVRTSSGYGNDVDPTLYIKF